MLECRKSFSFHLFHLLDYKLLADWFQKKVYGKKEWMKNMREVSSCQIRAES